MLALVVALLSLAVGAALFLARPPAPVKVVAGSPSFVLMTAADIPDVGWGLWDSGANGTGAWRRFSAHSEAILAMFNITLWVEPNATAAAARMEGITGAVAYPTQDGGVAGADASVFWSFDLGQQAGIAIRRYNVAFFIIGTSEDPFSLTRSDLGTWSGWQLVRIESLAR